MTIPCKTTVVFRNPFALEGVAETLPAGDYEIEPGLPDLIGPVGPSGATVVVRLHPRAAHPGLARILCVPLVIFERARALDTDAGQTRGDDVLDAFLADQGACRRMRADREHREDLHARHFGAVLRASPSTTAEEPHAAAAYFERMSPRPGSRRPGIGE